MSELEMNISPGGSTADHIRNVWWQMEQLTRNGMPAYPLEEGLPFVFQDKYGRRHNWRVMRMLALEGGAEESSYPAMTREANGNTYYLANDDVVRVYSPSEHTVQEAGYEALENINRGGELALRALRFYLGYPLAA
jgi:hypothetical protein